MWRWWLVALTACGRHGFEGADAGPVGGCLADDFDGAALGAGWTVSDPASPVQVAQTGGALVFTLAADAMAYNGVTTARAWDLTGRALSVELAQPPATSFG